MRFQFTLTGVSPILMHNGAAGIDTRSALSREIAAIAAKKAGDRTDVDDLRLQELECRRSLYLDADGKPALPEAALRAMIEASARKGKQGPPGPRGAARRGGLVPLRRRAVRRGRSTSSRRRRSSRCRSWSTASASRGTRARFDCPWSVVGVADVDEELVDREKLTAWLALGGRRIGLGDWRPEKQGGVFGRFDVEEVTELAGGGGRGASPPATPGSGREARGGEAARGGLSGFRGRLPHRTHASKARRPRTWRGAAGQGLARRGQGNG